jgi:hypothetical protein
MEINMSKALTVLAECVDARNGKRFQRDDLFDPAPTVEQAKRLVAAGCLLEDAITAAAAAEAEAEDGPTVAEYVSAGYLASNYPPRGYASRSTAEEIAAAVAAEKAAEKQAAKDRADEEARLKAEAEERAKADADAKKAADEQAAREKADADAKAKAKAEAEAKKAAEKQA